MVRHEREGELAVSEVEKPRFIQVHSLIGCWTDMS